MDELFNTCPKMDFSALEDEILGGVLENDNYLFFRTGMDDFDAWAGTGPRPFWQVHCTACHETQALYKSRGFLPSKLDYCPNCGASIRPKRWVWRSKLKTRILYYKFQRGEGRQVWLHAYFVTHDFCPEPGDEKLLFYEAARYLFEDGQAHKWTKCIDHFGRTLPSDWKKRKRVTKTNWKINMDSCAGYYPAFVGPISQDTIQGSCLEYSQLDRAIESRIGVPEYLDFYLKYPLIEYLWKFGLGDWLAMYFEHIEPKAFWKAVNLRAKKPKDLLRGLNIHEVKHITEHKLNYRLAGVYLDLRKAGIVTGTPEGWVWTQAVAANESVTKQANSCGIDGKTLRAYIERQAKRSGHAPVHVLGDYGDYLRQLEQLGAADGELFPADFQAAHERLSMRLNRQKNAGLTKAFRARRRLYRWLCWRQNGLLIRPIDSAEEITREGERQRNCVAGYAKRHAKGQTIICVLRRAENPSESWCTVELNPETLEVEQCRAYRNGNAPPEAQAFVDAWTERLKDIKFRKETA